jgi:hypothetical protein
LEPFIRPEIAIDGNVLLGWTTTAPLFTDAGWKSDYFSLSSLSLIYVWYHRNSPRAFVSIIYKMTDAIAHRGPDDEGYAVIAQALEPRFFSGRASPPEVSRAFSTIESAYGISGEIALGHRRFSIIDITPDGYAHNDALENS